VAGRPRLHVRPPRCQVGIDRRRRRHGFAQGQRLRDVASAGEQSAHARVVIGEPPILTPTVAPRIVEPPQASLRVALPADVLMPAARFAAGRLLDDAVRVRLVHRGRPIGADDERPLLDESQGFLNGCRPDVARDQVQLFRSLAHAQTVATGVVRRIDARVRVDLRRQRVNLDRQVLVDRGPNVRVDLRF
jgi:hypothetical protein